MTVSAATPAGAITTTPKADATTSFSYASDPGSWIGTAREWVGQGGSASYTVGATDSTVTTATMNSSQGALYVTFRQTSSNSWADHIWTIMLSAPAGQKFAVGTYDNAQRAPFNTGGAAGLAVFGDGRGCNQVYGSFTITKLVTDHRQLEYSALDVTYVQHCESPDAPALRGELKWNM